MTPTRTSVPTYSLADLVRFTDAKPRSIQYWAKSGVIRALRSTENEGSGTHREFSLREAVIACVIAAFAGRSVSVDGLLEVSKAFRQVLDMKLEPSVFAVLGRAAAGKGKAYLVVFWTRNKQRQLLVSRCFLAWDWKGPIPTFFELVDPAEQDVAVADVVALHVALGRIDMG